MMVHQLRGKDLMENKNTTEWLLLIHQIPPKPDYFRVKIWRRLQKIGAVAIKQSVYVLPVNDQSYEDLHWIVKEITEGGGTASLSKTVFLEGLSCIRVESLFQAARDADYEKIVEDGRSFLNDSVESSGDSDTFILRKKRELSRIRSRFREIKAIDFFNASGREAAERILAECNSVLHEPKMALPGGQTLGKIQNMCGRTWVSRKGIYVDRIACAWLIRRFIDPEARLKFVADERYRPLADEIRFDMFEGEYTHIGENCTFEVLVDTFCLGSLPITTIAEIVHDIDLKDKKFGRPEVHGIQAVFSGIAATYSDDQARLERGSTILDELYASYGGVLNKKL